MDKNFYVIPTGKDASTSHICYCGRCGRRQLLDQYNVLKHEQVCCPSIGDLQADDTYAADKRTHNSQIRLTDDVVIVEEKRHWGYRLEASVDDDAAGGVLMLSVCMPILKRIPGFTDRFSGMEWAPIFEAAFAAGSRHPRILRNETGYEMDVLLSLIRAGRISPISMESDRAVIRRVFPGVIDIYSLQMFIHIYCNKGYTADASIKHTTENWQFESTPNRKEWKALGVYEEKKGTRGLPWADYRDGKKNLRTANAIPENVRRPASIHQKGKTPIYAALFKNGNDKYILQVVLKNGQEKTVFLFTRGYCSCSREVDLSDILQREYYLVGKAMKAIEQFDKAYPEYHLAMYMYAEKSQNILIPLLAADYHTGIELAAKAGASAIAENYHKLAVFEKSPTLLHNLKEMFGVPVPVLRALRRDQVSDRAMKRIREIYEYQPAFLQFDFYTDSMVEFWTRGDVTHTRKRRSRAIEGIGALSDKQILQILRYLQKHPCEGHYYCDYMNACAQLGEYAYGITPSIPIREAHDRVVSRVKNKHDMDTKRRFETAVASEDYLYLTTCACEEDEGVFGEDPYMVMAPKTSDNLFRESENMHNCVRIYVKSVADRSTRIYFLRRKEEPDKSFGTIEVSSDGKRLIQAKAFGNRRLPRCAQQFVIKWCRHKAIKVQTWDIEEMPYGIA